MAFWQVPRMWDGGECWILGGGPSWLGQFKVPSKIKSRVLSKELPASACSPYLEVLHDRHVIAINNAYQVGEWIDFVFFGDCSWYLAHRKRLAEWPGLKVTCCNRFESKKKEDSEGIKYLSKYKKARRGRDRKYGISDNPRYVCWNHNSGAAAISLAALLGVKRIILLGFDMNAGTDVSHWHGSHSKGKVIPKDKRQKTYDRHLRGFPAIAEDAKKLGIEILNASPISTIPDFPKVKALEML